MSDEVSWRVSVVVKEGKLDAFKELMNEILPSAENQPQILGYEWALGNDQRTVHLAERHADRTAAAGHLSLFIELFFERFVSLIDELQSFSVYGHVDDALREMLAPMGAAYFEVQAGFAR